MRAYSSGSALLADRLYRQLRLAKNNLNLKFAEKIQLISPKFLKIPQIAEKTLVEKERKI